MLSVMCCFMLYNNKIRNNYYVFHFIYFHFGNSMIVLIVHDVGIKIATKFPGEFST